MAGIPKVPRSLLVCFFLAASTVAVFWPVVHYDFVNYDDPQYITENSQVISGLTWQNVKWALTTGYANNWHPLTWVSHLMDVQLFGLRPGGPHLVSLLFHVANTLLLFLVLKRMSGAFWRSAFVAALFGWHPLHVESVAWVAERKDVLSAFFFLLTVGAYERYVREKTGDRRQKTGGGRWRVWSWYAISLALFALGLMSKPMLVTTPFVLLLLDFWPLRRRSFPAILQSNNPPNQQSTTLRRLILEKTPFFLLSLLSCVVTLKVQSGAMANSEGLHMVDRLANATLAYAEYLRQTFWPTDLAAFYPHQLNLPATQTWGAGALLLAVSIAAIWLAVRRPYAFVGWFWFLGMLLPVIGLVQVGSQARADRYTYLPLIGIFILATWTAAEAVTQIANLLSRRTATGSATSAADPARPTALLSGRLAAVGGLVLLLALGFIAQRQVRYWQNSETLFAHAIKVTRDNYIALSGLGLIELHRGNISAGMEYLNRALDSARSHKTDGAIKYYIGIALQKQNRGLEALPYLEQAVAPPGFEPERNYRLALSLMEASRTAEADRAVKLALSARPRNPDFQLGQAALLVQQGQRTNAEVLFRDVLTAHPDLAQAHRCYADFLFASGRPAEAEPHYAIALQSLPQDPFLHESYASDLARLGKIPQAIEQLQQSLRLQSNNAPVWFALAELLSQQGRGPEAVECYDKALMTNPSAVAALNNLAWLMATSPDAHLRNGPRAVELAQRACQLTDWKEPVLMGTLAAADAEAGRFTEAVAMAEKARSLALSAKQDALAQRNAQLLELYRAGKPFRE